jgi:Excalibur calcium-binding domain/Protein of unknown function (DUF1524)
MTRSGQGRRHWRWCRAHPRLSLAAVVVALLVLIGALTGNSAKTPSAAGPVAPSGTNRPKSHAEISQPNSVSPAGAVAVDGATPKAADVLTTLTVKGRGAKTGYRRDQFGQAWSDNSTAPLGHNGCDTRNDVLRRDLTAVTIKPGSNGCTVLTGSLLDPYTGSTIAFQRGASTSRSVQIDHVVALSDAWQTGAQLVDLATRTALANDPLNLLAVDGPQNEAKGDGDAATWLPPNKTYRCAYVARQVAVKARYRLWLTPAEHDAIARILAACPQQGVPAEPQPAAIGRAPTATPAATTSSAPADVYYANCTAARAAGAAPLHRGDPGYRSALDRDGDGVACET